MLNQTPKNTVMNRQQFPSVGSSSAHSDCARELRAVTDTFVREGKKIEHLVQKKKDLEKYMVAPSQLKLELFEAKSSRWQRLDKESPAIYWLVFSGAILLPGPLVWPFLPFAFAYYHFSDNRTEKRLKKALLFPEELRKKYETLASQIEEAKKVQRCCLG